MLLQNRFGFQVSTSEMETELNWSHSSTHFTGFLNLSAATTESIVVEQSFKWTNAEIARMLQIIIRPILIVFGTVGNCLTFYIMRKTSLKDVSRKPQYKDVYRRTIEIRVHYEPLNSN